MPLLCHRNLCNFLGLLLHKQRLKSWGLQHLRGPPDQILASILKRTPSHWNCYVGSCDCCLVMSLNGGSQHRLPQNILLIGTYYRDLQKVSPFWGSPHLGWLGHHEQQEIPRLLNKGDLRTPAAIEMGSEGLRSHRISV